MSTADLVEAKDELVSALSASSLKYLQERARQRLAAVVAAKARRVREVWSHYWCVDRRIGCRCHFRDQV